MTRKLVHLVLIVALAGLVAAVNPAGADEHETEPGPLPIIFVHGASGSAAQYETAAQRFASNGYPIDRIRAYESGAGLGSLNDLIDDVLEEYDVDQVNLAAHSLGTFQMSIFLANAANAARVAKYAAIDGLPAPAAWVARGDGRTISAAPLGQGHVEAVSSPESFAIQYELFTGEAPATTAILPEENVSIAGRTVNFPANVGLDGALVNVWEVDPATGARATETPHASFDIDTAGHFGPVDVDGTAHYEFSITLPEEPERPEYHVYYQPFIRSNHLMRLNVAPVDSAASSSTNRGPNHTAAVIVRYSEWYTSHASGNNDILTVRSTSPGLGNQPAVNPLTNIAGNGTIGIHVHDDAATPGESSLATLAGFGAFQNGVDVYIPATTPPDGVVTFTNAPRGDLSNQQVINTPNWASSGHAVIVQFSDHAENTAELPLPIIFVHGASGSAAQYETAAQRFASNGYPIDRIRAYESGAGLGSLNDLIDDVLEEFDVDQVNLAAHSLGTFQMSTFLANAGNAARVAKYAAIDGLPAPAAWVARGDGRTISAAPLGQGHTEAVSSASSFAIQYQLFTGAPPLVTAVLPEANPTIAGRAVNFPANTGLNGATVRLFEVDEATGQRLAAEPDATFEIGATGHFGPVAVDGTAHYEFEVDRHDDDQSIMHVYYQPFIRSNHLVRLNAAPPGSASVNASHGDANHTLAVIVRYREWWTSHASGNNDRLTVSTTSAARGNQGAVSPLLNVTGNGTIGIHVHDAEATPGNSTLALLPGFGIFQEGVDLYMPAEDPPNGTVTFANAPRGDVSNMQVLNTPNWPSDQHAVIVQFSDHAQPVDYDTVTYTARFSEAECTALSTFATAVKVTVADLIRNGVNGWGDVAEAGGATPTTAPPSNDGPCAVEVEWFPQHAERITSTAGAWGVDEDQLHYLGGHINLYLLYLAIVAAG